MTWWRKSQPVAATVHPRPKPTGSRFGRGAAITALAISLIGGFEGLRTKAYLDPVKIPTICFGSTRGVKMGDEKTVEECKALLEVEIIEHELGIRKCLNNPDAIPEGAYVAFNSLAFNIGVGAFCNSTVLRRTNAGDYTGACEAILMWNKATFGGVKITLPGLTKRRQTERALCLGSLPP